MGRLRPYGDILFGRGEIDFPLGQYDATGANLYSASVGSVLSPGGGVEYDVDQHFAVRGDVQYQRYATPVTASGSLYATALMGAVVYRFDFNHHYHRPRHERPADLQGSTD